MGFFSAYLCFYFAFSIRAQFFIHIITQGLHVIFQRAIKFAELLLRSSLITN